MKMDLSLLKTLLFLESVLKADWQQMPPLGPFLIHQFTQLPCITTPSQIQGEEDSQKPPRKTKDDEQTLSGAAPDALRDNNDLTLMSRGELTYRINELACWLEKASWFCSQVTTARLKSLCKQYTHRTVQGPVWRGTSNYCVGFCPFDLCVMTFAFLWSSKPRLQISRGMLAGLYKPQVLQLPFSGKQPWVVAQGGPRRHWRVPPTFLLVGCYRQWAGLKGCCLPGNKEKACILNNLKF